MIGPFGIFFSSFFFTDGIPKKNEPTADGGGEGFSFVLDDDGEGGNVGR